MMVAPCSRSILNMNQPNARKSSSLVLVSLGLVLLAAVSTVAVPAAMRLAPPAPVIATLNLEEVIKNLEERSLREGEMKGFNQGLQGELDTLVKSMQDEQSKLAALSGGELEQATAKLLEMQANARVKKELYEAIIDRRRGKVFRELYNKIADASKRLGEKSGYTMVIASDESVQVPANAPSQDVERTISLKRFVFVSKGHDVTGELVTMMNNEFRAGGGSAAPAPSGK